MSYVRQGCIDDYLISIWYREIEGNQLWLVMWNTKIWFFFPDSEHTLPKSAKN